jgi:hypothetical protein
MFFQLVLQRRAPDQFAVLIPLERIGSGHGIRMIEHELDRTALDPAAELGIVDHVPVL